MKTRAWIAAGLAVAFSLSFTARGAEGGNVLEEYSDTRTNMVLWLIPPDLDATNEVAGTLGPILAPADPPEGVGSALASNAYKFIVVPLEPPPTTNYTLVGVIEVALTNAPAAKGRKVPDQVFVIDDFGSRPESKKIVAHLDAEVVFAEGRKMEWGDWLKPDRVLERWLELWTTETNATPVVVLLQEI